MMNDEKVKSLEFRATSHPGRKGASVADVLTAQQRKVYDLHAQGHKQTYIAQRLGISVAAVSQHLAKAKSRLGEATSAKPKQKGRGYVSVAERRRKQVVIERQEIVDLLESMPATEQQIVWDDIKRVVRTNNWTQNDLDRWARGEFTWQWVRSNLTRETRSFLERNRERDRLRVGHYDEPGPGEEYATRESKEEFMESLREDMGLGARDEFVDDHGGRWH